MAINAALLSIGLNIFKSIRSPKLKDSFKDKKSTSLAAIPAILATSIITGEVSSGDPLQDTIMTALSAIVTLILLIYRKHEDESKDKSSN